MDIQFSYKRKLKKIVLFYFRAVVPENSGPVIPEQKTKTRVCDLDYKDPLWSEHKGSPFPTVAEAIQEDLDKYR